MSVVGLLNLGAGGDNLLTTQVTAAAKSKQAARLTHASTKAVDDVRDAAASLVDAFYALRWKSSHTYSISEIRRRAISAMVSGSSARLDPVNVSPSILQTTRSINTQTSTVRSSSSQLGLDLTTDVSELFSASLGLDLTSPEAASRLDSDALGLDLSLLETPSTLSSDQVLNLDITSPESPSRLDSSAGLGLDVTSPETGSILGSSAVLGLDVTSPQKSSTITSTAEMNTAPTSYDPYLTFTSGTSRGTLSGVYTGINTAAGATSLIVKITKNGTVSGVPSQVHFDVLDQASTVLFTFTGSLKTGDQVYLGNDIGLSISFSAGTVVKNATATSAVSHTPTDVNAAAIFNDANLNLRPRFEGGVQVTTGSFSINGTNIAVLANDSINSVIARINASSAGVTASVSGDKITLATNGYSEDNIILANDTSGFLAATKLASATTVKGNIRDDLQVLAKTTQFASVTSGSFVVDGRTITIDRNTDSVQSIVSKINSSGARVLAAYDSGQDKITLNTTFNSEDDVPIGSDSSGFLSAAKLSAGNTVRGNIRDDLQVLAKTTQFSSVTSGSFVVDGKTITVDRNTDSVQSVIGKINSSGAGVTASFDASANLIRLATLSNSEDLITVADDISGFLTAAKLSSGNTVRGNIRDDQQALSKTTQFSSVASGSFTINGVTISVNRDTDSLSTLISQISASSAGVTASYNASGDKLILTGKNNSEDLIVVDNDTSGFLTAAHLATANTVRGHLPEDTVALYNLQRFSAVTDGSFEVDGKVINLTTSDTIQSIVTRINSSGARVLAEFDSMTNKLRLTTTYNSEDSVPIGSDTSGFLAAAGISPVNTVAGNIRDDLQVLSKTGQFSGVSSGSFEINGKTVVVDVNQDSLTTLLQKINDADAGVIASLNASTNKIELHSDSASDDLIYVGNDTSGFLAAAGLDTVNTIVGKLPDDQEVLSSTTRFGGITSGSFEINGISISVDPAQDTLQTLMGKINDAGAGVSAVYDNVLDKVMIIPDIAGSTLSLENDTSGFLSAAGIAAGTVGTHVNADAAFNATGLNAPLFDPGITVSAGSFTVNGTSIQVSESDSIRSVLSKINASDAGITATYDDTGQTLRLTTKLPSTSPIVVEGDTSGFIAAVKLDQEAESIPGGTTTVSAFDAPLIRMEEYSGVNEGTLTVNSQLNQVRPVSTTIRGLVSDLNADKYLSATLDEDTGNIRILSRVSGGNLTVSDTSGILSTLGIAEGDYIGIPPVHQVRKNQTGTVAELTNANEVVDNIVAAVEKLNGAIAELLASHNADSDLCTEMVVTVTEAVKTLVDAGTQGLSFGMNDSNLSVLVDREKLINSFNNSPNRRNLAGTVSNVIDLFTSQLAALAAPASQTSRQTTLSQTLKNIQADFLALETADPQDFSNIRQATNFDVSTLKKAMEAYLEDHNDSSSVGWIG